jgi:NADH-quinone oxidoreductase subunit G
MRGDEVFRVTARKDQWGEVKEWICNECRFERKKVSDWIIEGPTKVSRHSVISAGHYEGVKKPKETFSPVMDGAKPKLLLDIQQISSVNKVELSEIQGPATSKTFNGDPHSVGHNVTDVKLDEGRNLQGTDSTNPNV